MAIGKKRERPAAGKFPQFIDNELCEILAQAIFESSRPVVIDQHDDDYKPTTKAAVQPKPPITVTLPVVDHEGAGSLFVRFPPPPSPSPTTIIITTTIAIVASADCIYFLFFFFSYLHHHRQSRWRSHLNPSVIVPSQRDFT